MFFLARITCFISVVLATAVPIAMGQAAAPMGGGLYRTADDFEQHRLSLAGNCKTEKYRLRLNELLARPYVTVEQGGEEHRVAKASLYGFRDCNGRDYRFAGRDQYYPIVNSGEELLIYKVEQAPVGKTPGYVHLYFSATAAAPIQPLTLYAVKKAYPTNYRLHDLLDAQFHGRNDLAAFDDFHGMTKLNWLLQRSRATDGH